MGVASYRTAVTTVINKDGVRRQNGLLNKNIQTEYLWSKKYIFFNI